MDLTRKYNAEKEDIKKRVRKLIYDFRSGNIDDEDAFNNFKGYLFKKYPDEWFVEWTDDYTCEYLRMVAQGVSVNKTLLFAEQIQSNILEYIQGEYNRLIDAKSYYLSWNANDTKSKIILLKYFKDLEREFNLYKMEVYSIGELSLFTYKEDFYALDENARNLLVEEIGKLEKYLESDDDSDIIPFIEREIGVIGQSTSNEKENQMRPEKQNAEILKSKTSLPDIFKGLGWGRENKTDLAELVRGLHRTKAIKRNGKDLTLNEYEEIFKTLFNMESLNSSNLLRSRIDNKKKNNPYYLEEMEREISGYAKEMIAKLTE